MGGVQSRFKIKKSKNKIILPMILSVSYHVPVLVNEVLEGLEIKPGKEYIDATVGGGGHAFEIAKLGGRVLGIDQDEDALFKLRQEKRYPDNLKVKKGNFRSIDQIAKKGNFKNVAGILFDLGMSSHQIEKSERGFSYSKEEDLDMRMDVKTEKKAKELINNLSREDLNEIFTKFSEELNSRAIADAIFCARRLKIINNTGQLRNIIESTLKKIYKGENSRSFRLFLNSTLARIFQSIRMAVNDELESLKQGLTKAIYLLENKGRIAVISYHSIEDRIVKNTFKIKENEGVINILTKKPIKADYAEIRKNSRARSAKLRIAVKI